MEGTRIQPPANIAACDTCTARWLRYHDAQGRVIQHSPIGYIVLYLEIDGQENYFATVRSYADLRQLVSNMVSGTMFTAHLCIFMDEIGGGYYTRTIDGVEVRHESRAAEGLHIAMVTEAEQ